ncbi:MAG: Jag family protein [Thermodesulfobacteriota bacterium]
MTGEEVEIAKQLMSGLVERLGVMAKIEGVLKEGELHLSIKGDQEGMLIGRHGRTLDSLQFLINRMVNKRLERPVRIVLDINEYRERKREYLTKLAIRMGEKVKSKGSPLAIGPFNAHDRRLIHIALKGDSSVRTESFGEGKLKKVTIIPTMSKSH